MGVVERSVCPSFLYSANIGRELNLRGSRYHHRQHRRRRHPRYARSTPSTLADVVLWHCGPRGPLATATYTVKLNGPPTGNVSRKSTTGLNLRRTVSPIRLVGSGAKSGEGGGCRTAAHSVFAASTTVRRAAGPGPPWDNTAGSALPASPTGSDHPSDSRRVLRFLVLQVSEGRLVHRGFTGISLYSVCHSTMS